MILMLSFKLCFEFIKTLYGTFCGVFNAPGAKNSLNFIHEHACIPRSVSSTHIYETTKEKRMQSWESVLGNS